MSIIGALNEGRIKAPWVIEGHCNSEIVEAYVENILILILKPGQTVVLDNASFRKNEKKVLGVKFCFYRHTRQI